MASYFGDVVLVRSGLRVGLAAVYLIAFSSALLQFRPLLGEKGLLPTPSYLRQIGFWDAPSLFHWRYSDRLLVTVAWLGMALSVVAGLDLTAASLWIHLLVWLALWVLYLSIVNVGQTFYAFGWESLLLEAGFFAAFLGPNQLRPSILSVLLLRWLLFRLELGAGLVKVRHDPCWRDLTCLYYHHETQPLPNPLSWYFHRLPKRAHRAGVVFSHAVQLVVPFALFAPQPVASIAGLLAILHQLLLIVSGNYAWLNWITVVLGLSAFSDQTIATLLPVSAWPLLPMPAFYPQLMWILVGATVVLSLQPVANLLSSQQLMNYSYNPLHLVNTYGAFGSVNQQRFEIVLEGTMDGESTAQTAWREYEFKGKPGDPHRRPPQIAPYHLRLDWLMWFLPFSVAPDDVSPAWYQPWFTRLVDKLLAGDRATLALLRKDPFGAKRPVAVRARYYHYQFTTWRERRQTGAWWRRTLLGDYMPPRRAKESKPGSDLTGGTTR